MWRGPGVLPVGEARCRKCRHSYKTGCRCDECREKQNARCRAYRAAYRATTGRSLSREYRTDDLQVGSWIGKRRRIAHYERDGWCCQICGSQVDPDCDPQVGGRAPSLDHIVPRSLGGSDDDSNLRTAHRDCNARRGNRASTQASSGGRF